MTTTVTRHEERRGLMSSGQREYHYSVAMLSCGHALPGVLDHILVGYGCGSGVAGSLPDVGSEIACGHCARETEARAVIAHAANEGRLSHTRASRFAGSQTINAYGYDQTSPTGVRHLTSLDDTQENVAFLRAIHGGFTPLSPTEPR